MLMSNVIGIVFSGISAFCVVFSCVNLTIQIRRKSSNRSISLSNIIWLVTMYSAALLAIISFVLWLFCT